jgi:hypothetical protein
MSATSTGARRIPRPRCPVVVGLCLVAVAISARGGRAQSGPCDPALAVNADDPWQYKRRGARCEGRYLEPVGAASLRVVGYYSGLPWTQLPNSPTVYVSWPGDLRGPFHLRATSLRWRTFYRMDASVPGGESGFQWPTDVLRGLQLGGEDVALTATTIEKTLLGDARLLLPVTVGAEKQRPVVGTPTLILMSDADLDQIQLSAFGLAGTTWSRPLSPIRKGTFVAGRPIRIPLQGFPPGTHRLGLLGTGGGAFATGEATVYIPAGATQ